MLPSVRHLLAIGTCLLAVGAPATAVAAPQSVHRLNPQTLTDLQTSMRGEAFANASYTFYADQADREHLPAVADLYRRTAEVELHEHFHEEALLDGLIGDEAANLAAAIEGETYESTTMYPQFAREAEQDGDLNAAALFAEIAKDEAGHNEAFKAALHVLQTGEGQVPAPPQADQVPVPAGPPQVHAARTLANLDAALHGEALAFARYTAFAEQAAQSGDARVAALFTGTASVELHEHFAGEAVLFGFVKDTRTNLHGTIAGENYEATFMYPTFAKRARAAGDLEAADLFRDNARDEAGHARAFQQALRRID
ncbi:rubrerythrin family protein [Kitasatospora sp. NPDC004615]|uniref:rubrerythrin family protein n=1 Tax=unclassified Kitasatospora TaxID=2633591 RepID=UPI0036936D82